MKIDGPHAPGRTRNSSTPSSNDVAEVHPAPSSEIVPQSNGPGAGVTYSDVRVADADIIVRIGADGRCLAIGRADSVTPGQPLAEGMVVPIPDDARWREVIAAAIAAACPPETGNGASAGNPHDLGNEGSSINRAARALWPVARGVELLHAELEARFEDRTRELVERVAEQERAESRLRESYDHLRTVIEASPAAMVEVFPDGTVAAWNPAAEILFGWTAAEAVGKPHPIVPPERMDEFMGKLDAVGRGALLSGISVMRRTKCGRALPVIMSAAPLRRDGEIVSVLLLYDPSASAGAGVALDAVSERLAALKSLTTAISKSLDPAGVAAALRRELGERFGFRSGAICLPSDDGSYAPLEVWGVEDVVIAEVLREAATFPDDVCAVTAGERQWIVARLHAVHRDDGVLVVAGDGTDPDIELIRTIAREAAIALANAELYQEAEAARERTRELSRHMVAVQERQRRRIGIELHDQLGQMLTALHMLLEAMPSRPEDLRVLTAEADGIVADLIARVRSLALELRPPMLDEQGLIPALAWHVERYTRQTGIRVDFRHLVSGQLGEEVVITAFRIVQEALTNAARHAKASRLQLRVWSAGDRLLIEIADEGEGMVRERSRDGLGLAGMHERAALLGGTVTIVSGDGEGTTVLIDLPARDPREKA